MWMGSIRPFLVGKRPGGKKLITVGDLIPGLWLPGSQPSQPAPSLLLRGAGPSAQAAWGAGQGSQGRPCPAAGWQGEGRLLTPDTTPKQGSTGPLAISPRTFLPRTPGEGTIPPAPLASGPHTWAPHGSHHSRPAPQPQCPQPHALRPHTSCSFKSQRHSLQDPLLPRSPLQELPAGARPGPMRPRGEGGIPMCRTRGHPRIAWTHQAPECPRPNPCPGAPRWGKRSWKL